MLEGAHLKAQVEGGLVEARGQPQVLLLRSQPLVSEAERESLAIARSQLGTLGR